MEWAFTPFALPDRPVHSDTNSASPGSILTMLQLCATTKSLAFPPLSKARAQVLIYTAESTGASMERTKMPMPVWRVSLWCMLVWHLSL